MELATNLTILLYCLPVCFQKIVLNVIYIICHVSIIKYAKTKIKSADFMALSGAKLAVMKAIHTKVKGRARYKVNELYRSPSLKDYLERSLSNNPEITYVSANSLTSNILVIFQPENNINKIASLIHQAVLDFQKKFQTTQRIKNKKIPKAITICCQYQRTKARKLAFNGSR